MKKKRNTVMRDFYNKNNAEIKRTDPANDEMRQDFRFWYLSRSKQKTT